MIKKRNLIFFLIFFIIVPFVYADSPTNNSIGGGGGSTNVPVNNSTQNNSVYVDPQIYSNFNDSGWVKVIIDYNSSSSEPNSNWTNLLFSDISSSEIQNIREGSSNFFTAEITEEGLLKLLNSSYITKIYFNAIGHTANPNTPYVDPQIYQAFNNSEWTSIMVVLKDNSGINVTGTNEERRNLTRQITNWFKPQIEEVLSNLSEDEFKLNVETGIGFNGEISQQGFEKLKNNSLIDKIFWGGYQAHTIGNTSTLDNSSSTSSPISKKENNKIPLPIFLVLGVLITIVLIILIIKLKKHK